MSMLAGYNWNLSRYFLISLKAGILDPDVRRTVKPHSTPTCGFCGCCPWCWRTVAMGPLQRRGTGYFYLCVLQPVCGSKPSIREDVEGDFLLTLGQVWAGQRASQHAWPQGPFWSSTFRYAVTPSLLSFSGDLIWWRCEFVVDIVPLWLPGTTKCWELGTSAGPRKRTVDGASSSHHPSQCGFCQGLPGQVNWHRSWHW